MTTEQAYSKLLELAANKFNIEVIDDNWQSFTKALLNAISNDMNPISRLQKRIEHLKEQYDNISRPYVRGESYGGDVGGSPINSFKKSMEQNLHITRFEIDEEISQIAIEQRILEEQLKDEFDAFKIVCYTNRNASISETLMMFYLDKKTESEISIELGYTLRTIEGYIYQGRNHISKSLKKYFYSSK